MINDTEKRKNHKYRNAGLLVGACAFALALGALTQVVTRTDDPLQQQVQNQTSADSAALDTVPQQVQTTEQDVGWTPQEFASLADSIFEDASQQADAVFEGATEEQQSVAADATPVDGPVTAQKEYSLPCGTDIVKDFSMGIPVFSDTMQDWRTHNGVDFGGKQGDPVVAIADATVLSVAEDTAWGGVVELDHGNGLTAKYAGLQFDSVDLAEGDRVAAGDVIGTLGNVPVEAKQGSHLHFEMRVNGEIADPIELLGRGGTDE